jgi:hypothetical protein
MKGISRIWHIYLYIITLQTHTILRRCRSFLNSRLHISETTALSNEFFLILSGVRMSTAAIIGLLYQPQMIVDGDCGAIGGMNIGRGNRSTRRKSVLVPLYPPQIPHDLTQARTRVAAVGSQRLTA